MAGSLPRWIRRTPASISGMASPAGSAVLPVPAVAVQRGFLQPFGVAFSPDGGTLVAANNASKVYRWDTAVGRELPPLMMTSDLGPVHAVAFSSDGLELATMHRNGSIGFWDRKQDKLLRKIAGKDASGDDLFLCGKIAYSPDGRFLVSGDSHSDTFQVWHAASGRRLRTLRPPPRRDNTSYNLGDVSITFSPDSRCVAVGGSALDYTVRLWEIATGKERLKLGGGQDHLTSAAFSPDGRVLMLRKTHGDTLYFRDAATGQEFGRLNGHRGKMTAAMMLADNRRVLSGSEDTTLLVWDAAKFLRRKLQPQVLQPKEIEALWGDLCGQDAVKAHRAIGTLARSPQTAGFLKQRVRPTAAIEEQQINRWVADLNSRQFLVRQQARTELEMAGGRAEQALRRLLDGKPNLEVRRQAEPLLDKIIDGYPPSDQLGPCRAVEVLEQIGDAEARQVLQALAKGATGTALAREAQTSLQRLTRRATEKP